MTSYLDPIGREGIADPGAWISCPREYNALLGERKFSNTTSSGDLKSNLDSIANFARISA